MLFKEVFHKDALTITPVSMPISNKILINTRTDFKHEVSPYKVMIKDIAKWINKHPTLYPHYFIS